MGPLEIEPKHIGSLNPEQLTRLLKKLLHLEAEANNILKSAVDVSLKINMPDGGEDGRIQWKSGPEETAYIPNRFTLFQCKAQSMGEAKCKNEIFIERERELKPKVKEVFDARGTYVLFYYKTAKRDSLINGFRKGLKRAGRGDWQTADIKIYDAEKIADWVNEFLQTVVYVCNCNSICIPCELKTWEMWAEYEENKYEYIPNTTLKGYIKTLREESSKEHSVIRIVGLSGLGKTRLALEAFRPSRNETEINQELLSNQILYLNTSIGNTQILSFVTEACNRKIPGILIIDDCEFELHSLIAKEVGRSGSRLKLITLDFNPEEEQQPKQHLTLPHL